MLLKKLLHLTDFHLLFINNYYYFKESYNFFLLLFLYESFYFVSFETGFFFSYESHKITIFFYFIRKKYSKNAFESHLRHEMDIYATLGTLTQSFILINLSLSTIHT